jgi:Putative beta-barrel porin-2, OmpL-like. bbp2
LSGSRVHWQGIAAYAKIQANDWFAFSPRFEWYSDSDGFTTGTAQTLKDITLTSEQKINKSLITRLEYRRDFSDKDFFLKSSDRIVRAQSTLSFGLVYAFSSKGDQ